MITEPQDKENYVDGAIVNPVDLPKVLRLRNFGFELSATPTRDGRIYVIVTRDPRKEEKG